MLKDYEQIAGKNYNEIYAEIIRSEISRLLLSLTAKYDWGVDQLNTVTAFLNLEIDREIYIWLLKNINISKNMICKLNLTLYSIK
jgi:hypothetical protein